MIKLWSRKGPYNENTRFKVEATHSLEAQQQNKYGLHKRNE